MAEPMTAARLADIEAMYGRLPDGAHRDKRLAQTVPEMAAEIRQLRAQLAEAADNLTRCGTEFTYAGRESEAALADRWAKRIRDRLTAT